MQHREIFTAKYLREVGKHFDLLHESPTLVAIRQHVADWQASFYNGTIIKQSEIQLQKEFLSTFFAGCLGYHTKIGRSDWELDYEQTTEVDATRADGYLGFFTPNGQKTIAVIELKDASTDLDRPQNRKNDKRSPVEQAFSYVPKVGQDCRWVIVSNFVEIRLYHAQDQGRYEYFHVTQLHQDEQLWRFLFLLHRDRLLPHGAESYLEHYHRQRLEQEQTISLDFYKKFKDYRQRLFQHLKVQNPEQPELLLFEKTQKLLDRIIFVLFCEDKGLLPVDIIRKVRQAAHASLDPSEGQGFWGQLKGLFRSIDKGNPALNINRYNGGLFAHDPELDELRLDDSMVKVILSLSEYDFDSDLNVNILGHIFEQSISDIEEIKADIGRVAHLEGVPHVPAKQSKRKKDGIFYTPEYITRYIVREAVGGWLDDRKRELGFEALTELSPADLATVKIIKGRPEGNASVEKHRASWTAYREVLANIKVLDPACGSGAFLIQVFDYLSAEGDRVNDELARLSIGLRSTDDLSRNILSNNIFGVDINAESVEISKLALWLKTANIHSELNSLDQNIKCGNSLIDDPAVAGDLAFDWETEFAEIFEQKGGFDVVVGNPPYVRVQNIPVASIDYFFKAYKTPSGKIDLSMLFFEKALEIINKLGVFSFISSSQWMQTNNGEKLRSAFSEGYVKEIVDFGSLPVFQDADTYPAIFVISKEKTNFFKYRKVENKINLTEIGIYESRLLIVSSKSLNEKPWVFDGFNLNKKLENGKIKYTTLGQIAGVNIGDLTGLDKAFIIHKEQLKELNLEPDSFYPYAFRGEEVNKFSTVEPNYFAIYPYKEGRNGESILFSEEEFKNRFPNTYNYLLNHKEELMQRMDSRKLYALGDNWFRHLRQGTFGYINPEKMIVKGVDTQLSVGLLKAKTLFNGANCPGIILNESTYSFKYLLAVLNSKLTTYYLNQICPKKLGGYYRYNATSIATTPIVLPASQSPFIAAADQMLALHSNLHTHKKRFLTLVQAEYNIPKLSRNLENWESLDFKGFAAELVKQKVMLTLAQKSEWLTHFEQERAVALGLQEQIRSTDQRIDEMVFDLYGLTAEERALVLGA